MEEKIEQDNNNNLGDESNLSTPILVVNSAKTSLASNLEEKKESKEKNGCKFPTAYTILLLIEAFVFLLIYIIPKGQFYKIEYNSDKDIFIIKTQNGTTFEKKAEQSVLDEYKIKIPLDSFKRGYIKKPIWIPDTYERIDEKPTNFLFLFLYPILGIIESADIQIFLLILGGVLNVLIEMNALSAGLSSLAKITKGKEFLLIILVFIIMGICGSIFGLLEEILAFYPLLMPVFLKNGIDGILGASPLYLGAMMGNMFSTTNAFTVVLGSYSSGIPFTDGIVFRSIAFILGMIISIIYLFYYFKKIREDETKSIVYDIKNQILETCLKFEKKEKEKGKENKKEENERKIETNNENILLKEGKENDQNKEKENIQQNENSNDNKDDEDENHVFSCKQKISLLLFTIAFGIMIFGIMAYDWWFKHMAALFLGFGIIFIILLKKGENKGLEIFIRGAGDFVGVTIIIGISAGINITLEEGKIADTILNSLSNAVSGLHKIIFAIVMLIIFTILGIFISSASGLATLSMPILAPLGDGVGCDRKVIVNTFMYGQHLSGLMTPTGIILIVLQMIGIPYNYWIKFIWPFMAICFVFLTAIIIIDVLIES